MKQDEELTDSIFITSERELQSESWRIMLNQPTEKERYEKKQKQILKEIFDNY